MNNHNLLKLNTLALSALVLVGCNSLGVFLPTLTPHPTYTPLAVVSPTTSPSSSTATATSVQTVAVPPTSSRGVRITAENVERVTRLAHKEDTKLSMDIAWSPDQRIIAIGATDGVYLFDVETLAQIRLIPHYHWVRSVAFSPDGTLLATGCFDNIVRLWRVSDGSEVRELKGHTNAVRSITFSPDATLIGSGGADETVRLWRVSDGKLIRELKGHKDEVYTVAFGPDGSLLASGAESSYFRETQGIATFDSPVRL